MLCNIREHVKPQKELDYFSSLFSRQFVAFFQVAECKEKKMHRKALLLFAKRISPDQRLAELRWRTEKYPALSEVPPTSESAGSMETEKTGMKHFIQWWSEKNHRSPLSQPFRRSKTLIILRRASFEGKRILSYLINFVHFTCGKY